MLSFGVICTTCPGLASFTLIGQAPPAATHFGLKKLNVPLVAGVLTGALSIWAKVPQAPWAPLAMNIWKPTSPTVTGVLEPPSSAWMVWKRPDFCSAADSTFHAALTSTALSLSPSPAGNEITCFCAKAICLPAS